MKSQGTNKIGQQCTAHMRVKVAKDTGHATVNYCATYSHPIKLSQIKIPTRIRLDIAAQLQQGVSMEIVLDRILQMNLRGNI